MSGLIVTLFFLGALAASTLVPVIAMYVFSFSTYMAVSSTLYGPGITWPWRLISGIVALIAWLLLDKKYLTKISTLYFIIIIWMVWVNITSIYAVGEVTNFNHKYNLAVKTLAACLLATLMLYSRVRIEGYIVVIIAAIGFFIGKGLISTILTGGGGYAVVGSDSSPVADRNYFAMAVWMIIPLLMWLAGQSMIFPRVLAFRVAMIAFTLICVVVIIGTQSRGALVAAPAFFAYMLWQSKRKLPLIMFGFLMIAVVLVAAPEEWWQRMQTISEYSEDGSALSRLHSWEFGWNYAIDHPWLGGGFRVYTLNFNPAAGIWLDAHSIYFEVLAEHGFPGLMLFLLMIGGLILNGRYISKACRKYPDLLWAADLGEKLSISIVLYMVCGAFLSAATNPILYDFAAISLGLRHLVNRELAEREAVVVPVARRRWAPDAEDDDVPETGPREPSSYGSGSWRERRKMRLTQLSVGSNPTTRKPG